MAGDRPNTRRHLASSKPFVPGADGPGAFLGNWKPALRRHPCRRGNAPQKNFRTNEASGCSKVDLSGNKTTPASDQSVSATISRRAVMSSAAANQAKGEACPWSFREARPYS